MFADWRRYYHGDIRDDLREAIRHPHHWAFIEAQVKHLPPESATKRALGHYTVEERIADTILQVMSAHRAEFIGAHGGKRPPDVVSVIAQIEDAKRPPPSFDDVYARFAPLIGEPPTEEGGTDDASRVD